MLDRLLDAIDLAIRANNGGGLEFRKEYCRCDASVGMVPCEYCAVDSALRQCQRFVASLQQQSGKDGRPCA